jgi:hypothetical protein
VSPVSSVVKGTQSVAAITCALAATGGLSLPTQCGGTRTETIRVTAETPPPSPEPSQNVINLQQRAAGVLPIPVDVPRAGTSHQFVKPLVVDQEAVVMLRYKRK